MASSKKSLADKFAMEQKPKSPSKKSKKGSKVSKSLSRELTGSSSPLTGKKKAQKSSSDSLVGVKDKGGTTSTSVKVDTASLTEGLAEGRLDKRMKASLLPDEKLIQEPMEIDTQKHVHIEKLDTSFETTWTKPDDDSVFLTSESSRSSLPAADHFTAPVSRTESHAGNNKTTDSKSIGTGVSSDRRKHSVSAIVALKKSMSTTSTSYSTDSLASEMESYRLGTSRSSSSSEIDTLRHSDSNSCEDINIGECSSTSTPIKFSLFDEHKDPPTTVIRKPPPKFSLIREAASEDLDSLSLSDYSPTTTTTSLKSFDGRNRIDDFSDESDSSRMKESSEFSDDPDFHSHAHFVPLNKQLQIVTSMDRLMDR